MLLWLIACTKPSSQSSALDSASTTEAPSELNLSLEVVDTFVETVKKIRWDGETQDKLVYTDSMGETQRIHSELVNGKQEAMLKGFPSFAIAEAHVERALDDWILQSPVTEIALGGLPSVLPQISVEGQFDGYLAVPIIGENEHALAIINGKGEFVWAVTNRDSQANLSDDYLWVMAAFGKDQESILVQSDAHRPEQTGYLYRYNWAGERIETHGIPGGHLSFVEVDIGHYYVLGYEHADTLDDNGERIRNDTVVELKDGEQETVWTALDAFPYEVFGGANSPDWMHVNYLAFDSHDQTLLLSIARLDAYAKLDLETKTLSWIHSTRPAHTSISSEDPQQISLKPHSIEALGNDQYLVFNRDAPSGCSEWVQVEKTPSTNGDEMTVIDHKPSSITPCLRVIFLGQSFPLPETAVLSNYSDKGRIEVHSINTLYFSLQANLGNAFGFLQHRINW